MAGKDYSYRNLNSKVVADVMELIEKKSKDEIEMMMLSALVAEQVAMLVKKHWRFNEDYKKVRAIIQAEAVRIAGEMVMNYL